MKFFASRYRIGIAQLSLVLQIALGQRRDNLPFARMDGDQARKTQIYDSSLYGFRPTSH